MTIALNTNRQEVIHAMVSFTQAGLTLQDGTVESAITVPQGAIVVGGGIVIDTAFDSTTSDTLTVGDGGVAARYVGSVDGQTAGYTALVPTGYEYPAQDTVDVGNTQVGGAGSAGEGRLLLSYVVNGRAAFSQD